MPQATFGVEEEYLLLDKATGLPVNRAAELIREVPELGDRAEREFLSSQLETATAVCETADEAYTTLRHFRETVQQAASRLDMIVAGTGLPPVGGKEQVTITPQQRYLTLEEEMRSITEEMYVTGTHVHVSIPSADAGVDVLARLGRWAPMLLAMTANSPIWQGEDTGFASWRHLKSLAWPIVSYPPEFKTGEEYRRSVNLMVESGMILDPGVVTWVARLSQNYPTIELRIADAQLDARDAVAFATLVRGLVSRALSDYVAGAARPDLPRGLVTGGVWLAARNGLETNLVDPLTGEALFAFDAVQRMIDEARPELEATGDLALVEEYVERLRNEGSPAKRQRDRYLSEGLPGLLRLYAEHSESLREH